MPIFPEWGVIKLEQDKALCLTCRSMSRHCIHCKLYLGDEGISREFRAPISPKRFEKQLENKLDKESGCFKRLSHSKEKLPFWPDDARPEFEDVKRNYEGL